ncbi:MAG: protocatechuate 3,4-dioxygenase [Acidobacteriota bacterium]
MKLACLLIVLSLSGNAAAQAPQVAERTATARASVVAKDEPGEKLVVKGTVYAKDGMTPLVGTSVYVYQTDAKGLYTPGNNDNRNPRLRGYMRTDAQGKYEFATIKPAPYPGNQIPAHIHYVVTAPGYQQRIFEIIFEGDPLIDAKTRANAAQEDSGFSLRSLTRDQSGVWQCTQDVRLRR